MIVTWLIGFLLILYCIWLYKNTRINNKWSDNDKKGVMTMWQMLLYIAVGLVPILNIVVALAMIAWWCISVYNDKSWCYIKEKSHVTRVVQFLTKPVE